MQRGYWKKLIFLTDSQEYLKNVLSPYIRVEKTSTGGGQMPEQQFVLLGRTDGRTTRASKYSHKLVFFIFFLKKILEQNNLRLIPNVGLHQRFKKNWIFWEKLHFAKMVFFNFRQNCPNRKKVLNFRIPLVCYHFYAKYFFSKKWKK